MNNLSITGDCHGDFQRFTTRNFPQLQGMDRDDCVIICGDHGGVWAGEQADKHKLDWLEDKPFTTLFVDGNHENFDLLNAYPEQEWHGGKVHVVRPHVLHLMRGQVFEIGGLTWFTMGGAASHDIEDGILDPAALDFERRYWELRRMNARFRVLGRSWWSEEMPSEAEYAEAASNLERARWCVDCVLTHCAPTSIAQRISRHYQPDMLTDFLETERQRCQFSQWFCGHYHINQVIDEQFVIQWEQISKIEAVSI